MILVEQATVPVEALPVAEFRDYLRLGTGFTDDAIQDGVLETCLRAAIAAIEARTGKAILERGFRWSLTAWRDHGRQVLPIAPVSAVTRLFIVDRQGAETDTPVTAYALERDAHRPALASAGGSLPSVPIGGSAEIEFNAGYGPAWSDAPPALKKAVLMLAAHYYEHRHAMAFEADGIPSGISDLLLPFLNLRLFGGGRS